MCLVPNLNLTPFTNITLILLGYIESSSESHEKSNRVWNDRICTESVAHRQFSLIARHNLSIPPARLRVVMHPSVIAIRIERQRMCTVKLNKHNGCRDCCTAIPNAAGMEDCFSCGRISICIFFAGSKTVCWETVVVVIVVVLAPLPWQWHTGWGFRGIYRAQMTGSPLLFTFSSFPWFPQLPPLFPGFIQVSLAPFPSWLEPCIVNYVGSEWWSGGSGFHILVWY